MIPIFRNVAVSDAKGRMCRIVEDAKGKNYISLTESGIIAPITNSTVTKLVFEGYWVGHQVVPCTEQYRLVAIGNKGLIISQSLSKILSAIALSGAPKKTVKLCTTIQDKIDIGLRSKFIGDTTWEDLIPVCSYDSSRPKAKLTFY